MRDVLKLGVFLLIVAGVAGLGLGYVNSLTAPVILAQEEENKISGFKEVYSQAEEIKDESAEYLSDGGEGIVKEVNVAYQNGNQAGVIYMVEPKGYGGEIQMLVAFDIASKEITAIKVLSNKETPGLGAKCSEEYFSERFQNKNAEGALELVKQEPVGDNQVMAITAATITSKAVVEGVNTAREHFVSNFL